MPTCDFTESQIQNRKVLKKPSDTKNRNPDVSR